jgi:hypothetical protein
MTCLYGEVKIKISIIFYNNLSVLHFIDKYVSEINLRFFIFLDGVISSA